MTLRLNMAQVAAARTLEKNYFTNDQPQVHHRKVWLNFPAGKI